MILKFRAWLIKEKQMCNVDFIDFHERFIESDYEKILFDDMVLEQYTGLKDKNGKEIYEGDILQDTYSKDDIGKVCWYKEHANFVVEEKDAIIEFAYYNSDYYEIIGNIHENSELLEAK